MKGSLRYRLLFLGMLLLVGLCLLNPSLLTTYVIDPLTRFAWLVIRTFLVIDQRVYWTLLIFSAFVFILRIFPTRTPAPPRPAYLDSTLPEDRTAYWEALLRSAEDDVNARATLQQELMNLSRSVHSLTNGGGVTPLELPPVSGSPRRKPLEGKRQFFLGRPLQKPADQQRKQLENSVAAILESLESKVEINHD